jgi:hypothetical protein
MAACMIDEKASEKILLLSSPVYMIHRRIQDCTVNVLDELVQRLRLNESFTIQLDKSTNADNLAILLILASMFMRMNFKHVSYSANQLEHKQQAKTFSDFRSLFYKLPK